MKARRFRIALTLALILVPSTALAGAGTQAAGTWRRLPAAPITPEFNARTSVWTGKEMLVFGRDQLTALDSNGKPYSTGAVNVAAAYDPGARAWRRLSPPRATSGFMGLSAVWTGKEMLVWGQGTREAYNPSTNQWRRLPDSKLLAVHDGFAAVVWTGRAMIGWGGGCCGDAFDDGVAYNPATNAWRALARSPLPGSQHPLAAWTGRKMLVVSGARAALYDPTANAWKRIASMPAARVSGSAVWTGREVLVVGGARVGFAYSLTTNRWRRLPALPIGRIGRIAVWTGSRLLVWGGKDGGAAYDPTANRWAPLPRGPLPARLEPTAVWTGRTLIVWGGVSTKTWGKYGAAGAAYTPSTP
jgi:N-acetylneuraminic acid mutarotase